MNVKEALELIDYLDGLDVIESLVSREITLTQEMGNPTTERYKKLEELYSLIREVSR